MEPTDATIIGVYFLNYINLYMFRALLCPSSGDKKMRLVNTSCEATWLCWLQLYGAAMWALQPAQPGSFT
jgi:hypothetical protein